MYSTSAARQAKKDEITNELQLPLGKQQWQFDENNMQIKEVARAILVTSDALITIECDDADNRLIFKEALLVELKDHWKSAQMSEKDGCWDLILYNGSVVRIKGRG